MEYLPTKLLDGMVHVVVFHELCMWNRNYCTMAALSALPELKGSDYDTIASAYNYLLRRSISESPAIYIDLILHELPNRKSQLLPDQLSPNEAFLIVSIPSLLTCCNYFQQFTPAHAEIAVFNTLDYVIHCVAHVQTISASKEIEESSKSTVQQLLLSKVACVLEKQDEAVNDAVNKRIHTKKEGEVDSIATLWQTKLHSLIGSAPLPLSLEEATPVVFWAITLCFILNLELPPEPDARRREQLHWRIIFETAQKYIPLNGERNLFALRMAPPEQDVKSQASSICLGCAGFYPAKHSGEEIRFKMCTG